MISKKIEKAFNKQINAEIYSSYLYLSMAAYVESETFKGIAHWLQLQAQEELAHAMKFYNFIYDRGGRVELAAIEGPKTSWKSLLDVFENVYEHECKVTGLINDLVDLALAEKDHASNAFLQWFVNEQVEEEATAQEIVDKMKLASESKGNKGGMIYMIDKELGSRTISASAGE
jgi:ferritin